MRRLTVLVLLLSMAGSAVASKVPDAAWQAGTLQGMTTDSQSRLHGFANDRHAALNTSFIVVTHYLIDGPGGYTYEASWLLKGRHPHQLLVTIHGPIQFALVGHDFYIKDDEGKMQKLAFISRSIKPADPK